MSTVIATATPTSAAISDGIVRASVDLMGRNREGRQEWRYSIACESEAQTGTDLRTGVGATETGVDMLRTLAGFLAAHSESSEGGECADLFDISREATEAISEVIYYAVGWDA